MALGLLTYLRPASSSGAGSSGQDLPRSIIYHLDPMNNPVAIKSRSTRSANPGLTVRQLETCQILGLMPDCVAFLTERNLNNNADMDSAVYNLALGKRNSQIENNAVQRNIKRGCNVNLGFHCQTEHYSAIADMYNWLKSSLSPGRRKRRESSKLEKLLLRKQ